jgi:signal transduction histidine kinase
VATRTASRVRRFQQFSGNRLFEGVQPKVFSGIGRQLGVRQLRKGEVIFREGDPGNSLYLVGKGSVLISRQSEDGEAETVGLIESDNFFGATALLAKEPRSTMAIAAEPTVLGTVKEKTFQQILQLAPSVVHLNFLRAVNERMRRVNTHFMNDVLRAERLRIVDAIADSILRDLKNPVCIARCCSDLITREADNSRLRELSKMLGNAVSGLLCSAHDLREYTRGEIVLQKQTIRFGRVLEQLEEESLSLLTGKKIEVVKHIRYDGDADVDFARIVRVLGNLVRNAVEAMPGGGSLTLTADLVYDQIVLRISDSGRGISSELVTRAFEPFGLRGESSHGGVSLAVAKSVVEAHGGKISLASVPGKGTTIDIRLPKPPGE